MEQETRIMEPIPAEDEIRITATPLARRGLRRQSRATRSSGPPREDRDLQHRERIDTPRVRHLFPVPRTRTGRYATSSSTTATTTARAALPSPQARPAAIATRSSPVANR